MTTDLAPDPYYSPRRVVSLLRAYPTLASPAGGGDGTPSSTNRSPNPAEHSWCLRADIARALDRLDWWTRQVVIRAYIHDQPYREIAGALGINRHVVLELRRVGPTAMAQSLGWRPRKED